MTTTAQDTLTPFTFHDLARMQAEVRAVNEANGWFDADRSRGEGNALLHSEVAEALEAYRDWKLEDPTEEGWGVWSVDDRRTYQVGEWRDGTWIPGGPTDAAREADALRLTEPAAFAVPLHKPEGVGSELADVLIRLLDEADRQSIPLDYFPLTVPESWQATARFGDALAGLHMRIAQAYLRQDQSSYANVYACLVGTCEHFGIDLAFEYHRKLAFNKTRGYRHGGRTL